MGASWQAQTRHKDAAGADAFKRFVDVSRQP